MEWHMVQLFDIAKRVVVVTGATSGIGRALACGLHELGAVVVACGRSPEGLAALPLPPGQRVQCDQTVPAQIDAFITDTWSRFSRIDGLINCAGVTADTWENTIETNLTGAYRMTRAVVEKMLENGIAGSIVNVTSIGAHQGFPDNPQYVASKGGLRALTRALALDVGPSGIRVNNLCPGYVRTPMTEQSFQDSEKHRARSDRTCLGRWGQPGDLVGPAAFLISDASVYMTGADLVVDGGWLARGL